MVTAKHQDDYGDVKPKEKVHVVKRPTKKVRYRSRGAFVTIEQAFPIRSASDCMEGRITRLQSYDIYHDIILIISFSSNRPSIYLYISLSLYEISCSPTS
jgi:hypothetical protein